MKTYRVYEAFRNDGGGVEGTGSGWEEIQAKTAEEAAREFWGSGWDADENTVIVATDDDTDSFHLYPEGE
jgi:hypothetical protein